MVGPQNPGLSFLSEFTTHTQWPWQFAGLYLLGLGNFLGLLGLTHVSCALGLPAEAPVMLTLAPWVPSPPAMGCHLKLPGLAVSASGHAWGWAPHHPAQHQAQDPALTGICDLH